MSDAYRFAESYALAFEVHIFTRQFDVIGIGSVTGGKCCVLSSGYQSHTIHGEPLIILCSSVENKSLYSDKGDSFLVLPIVCTYS